MSVNLGSAHGDIILDGSGIARGVQQAVSALQQLEGRAKQSGQSLDTIATSAQKAGAGTAQGMQAASRALQQTEQQAQKTKEALGTIGTAATAAGGALAAPLALAVKTSADFESQLSAVKAATGATAGEMDQLRNAALALGQDTTLAGVSASGAAQAMGELGKAGISVADQIGGATRGALLLASAGGLQFGEAATIAANAMTVFGKSGADVAHIADLFAASANQSTIDVRDLGLSMNQVGLVAAQMGQSLEQTVGVLTAFGAAGLKGSDAGTSLKQLMLSLVNPSKEAADTIQRLGLNFFDAQGHMLSFAGIAEQLQAHLSGLTDQQRQEALATIFGSDAIRGALILYNQGAAGITKYTEAINQSGSAAAAGATRNDNLRGSIEQLKSSLETLAIAAGKQLIPDLRGGVDQLTALVNAFNTLSPAQQGAIVHTAAFAAGLLLLAGGLTKAVTGVMAFTEALTTVAGGVRAASVALVGAEGVTAAAGAAAAAATPLVIAIAAGFGLLALGVQESNKALQSTARLVGGDLGDALSKIKFDWRDMFAGGKGEEDKVRAVVRAWADGLPGATDSIARMRYELQKANTEADRLQRQTFRGLEDQGRLDLLRAEARALEEEIKRREELNRLEAIRNAYLTQEAEAGAQYTPPPAMDPSQVNRGSAALAGLTSQAQRLPDAVRGVTDALANLAKTPPAVPALQSISQAMQQVQQNSAPMQAALDAINAKLAQGLPLTAQEAQLKGQLARAVATNSAAYADLAIQAGAAALAEFNAGQGGATAAGGIGQTGGAAGAASGQVRALQAALVDLNSAFGALSAEDAKLQAFYNQLDARVKVLQDKADAAKKGQGAALTKDEAAELAHLLDLEDQIGKKLGENAAKKREIVEQELANEAALRASLAAQKAFTDHLNATKSAIPFQSPAATPQGPPAPVTVPVVPQPQGPLAPIFTGQPLTLPLVKVPVALETSGATSMVDAIRQQIANKQGIPFFVDPNPALSGIDQINQAIARSRQAAAVALPLTADPAGALGAVSQVQGALDRLKPPPLTITANPSEAVNGVGLVQGALDNLPQQTTIVVSVDNQASGPLNGILDLVNSVPRSFGITATVDTSGALAAIADLRAHMPASPAKKGPFSRLPNWASVYDTLAPAGEAAVATTQGTVARMSAALTAGIADAEAATAKANSDLIASVTGAVKAATEALTAIREVKLPGVGRMAAFARGVRDLIAVVIDAAAQFDGPGLEAAATFSDRAGKIVGLVKPAVEAFQALPAATRPTADALGVFTAALTDLTLSLVNAAAIFDADGLAGAVTLAEAAGKIVGLVKPAIEAFAQFPDVVQPTGDQLGVFTQGIIDITLSLVRASQSFDGDGLAGATDLADAAGKIIGLVRPAVEGFRLLVGVIQPTGDQLGVFTQGVIDISLSLVQASRLFTAEGLAGARDLADTAGKILGLIKPAIDGFAALPAIVQPTGDQLGVFTQGVTDITLSLVQAARLFGAQGLAGARDLADTAGKALGLIGPALTGFRQLASVVAPSQSGVATWRAGIVAITAAIVEAGRLFASDGLAGATALADTAGKALGLVGQAITSFKALNGPDFAPPDAGRLGALVAGVRGVVVAVGEAARTVQRDLASEAATFADEAGKSVGLVGQAIQAFAHIDDFTPPTDAQIEALKQSILLTVRRLAQAAREIDATSATAAGEFSESAGKAVSLIGSAISAFTVRTNVDKDGNARQQDRLLTTAEIDQIVALARYAVGQLVGIAGSFDKGALARLSDFGDAASKGFGALRGVLDSLTVATKDEKPQEGALTPRQAIDRLIALFQDGLGQLTVLAGLANQYRTAAGAIKHTMADAGRDLGEALASLSLPQGVSTQALGLAAGATITVRQEVVHTFTGTVTLTMPSDDGAFVARSLSLDGKSRHEVADLIAAEIAAAAPVAGGQAT